MDFAFVDRFKQPHVQPAVSAETLYVVPAIVIGILTVIIYLTIGFEHITYKAYYPSNPFKLMMAMSLALIQTAIALLELEAVNIANVFYSIALCMPSVAAVLVVLDVQSGSRPSLLLESYMFLQLLTDLVRTWSYHSQGVWVPASVLACAAAAFRSIWVFWDNIATCFVVLRTVVKDLTSEIFREVINLKSIRRRIVRFVSLGFRDLDKTEALPDIDLIFKSERLAARFDQLWVRANKKSKYVLVRTCTTVLLWPLLSTAPLRICYVACQLYQIQVMRQIIAMLEGEAVANAGKLRVVVQAILASTALLIIGGWRDYKTSRFDFLVRGLLSCITLKKSFHIHLDHLRQNKVDGFCHSDISAIIGRLGAFHTFWLAPLEITVGVYFFYMLQGTAVLFLLPALIAGSVTGYVVGHKMTVTRKMWTEAAEQRDAEINAVVPEIKGIKMLGLENQVTQYLGKSQEREVSAWRNINSYTLLNWMSFVWVTDIPAYASIGGGMFLTGVMNELNAATAFDTLALTVTIVAPAIAFMRNWSAVELLIIKFSDVQNFMYAPELQDRRHISPTLTPGPEETFRCIIDGVRRPCITQFRAVSLTPGQRREPLLFDLNITIYQATTVLVTGISGSGKSTFLRALTGEATVVRGSISMYVRQGSITYCGHEAWLQNTTICDNIIGGQVFEEDWYEQVLRGCCLDRDIRELPGQDFFPVGKNGSNLSGGQCHRVALARAIYPRPSILVVDDILSALDPDTSSLVFNQLFGVAGLLNKWNITVVMATQSLSYLQVAHQVIFLDPSHEARVANGGGQIAPILHELQNQIIPPFTAPPQPKDERVTFEGSNHDAVALPRPAKLLAAESLGEVDAPLYFYLTKGIRKLSLVCWMILISLHATTERAAAAFLRVWSDTEPTNLSLYWVYTIVVWIQPVIIAADSWLYHMVLMPQSTLQFHKDVLSSVFGAPLPVLMSIDDGLLLNRVVNDAALTSQGLPMVLKGLIYGCSILSIDICLIINGIPQIVFFVPFLLLAGYWVKVFYFRALQQLRLLGEVANAELQSRNVEIRAGLEHIRAMGWYDFYLAQSFHALDDLQRIDYAKFQLHAWLGVFLHLITSAMMVIATALAVTMAGSLPAGGVFLAFFCAQFMQNELSNFFNWGTIYGDASRAAARIRAFTCSLKSEDAAAPFAIPQEWPERGAVRFDAVNATYRTPESSNTVLRGVSIKVNPGEKVGIVGRTGSGKSTLLLTFLNFLEYDGSITIDGIEIADVPEDQLRRRMTVIPQQAVLFPGTLRDNIIPWDLGNETKSVTDKDIMTLLQTLHLADHVELYGGINTPAKGMNFSHGQKQLVSIARAIFDHRVHRTKIILLDEVTSALHPNLENEVYELLDIEFEGCTTFIISHKTHVLDEVDVYIEISGGRILHRA